MSRTIVKSFIYAPTRKRIVLHADFDKEEGLVAYSVREIDGWGDLSDIEEKETTVSFPVAAVDTPFTAYNQADAHFKAIVLPMI